MRMRVRVAIVLAAVAPLMFSGEARGQQEEMCADRGINTLIEESVKRQSVIFGRISIKRAKGSEGKPPTVVVWLREGRGSTQRIVLEGSGSFCFEKSALGGEITIDLDGLQVDRRPINTSLPEQREDFEFKLTPSETPAPPGVVSAKFNYERKGKNAKLFERSLAASAEQNTAKAIEYLLAIVKDDPADYIASATLGSVYYRQKNYSDAEIWFKRSVDIHPEFTPAWISLAQSQYGQKKYELAIEASKKATSLDPKSAAGFYILGEAYLRTQKANPAVDALNEAIKLDPIGMAQCHLILADIYDVNGLKKLATKEYKAFLSKVPAHSAKTRIEEYIRNNPE